MKSLLEVAAMQLYKDCASGELVCMRQDEFEVIIAESLTQCRSEVITSLLTTIRDSFMAEEFEGRMWSADEVTAVLDYILLDNQIDPLTPEELLKRMEEKRGKPDGQ